MAKNPQMDISEFLEQAPDIDVSINGVGSVMYPRTFSTGSVGYNDSGKRSIKLKDGRVVTAQLSLNLAIVDSKTWPDGKNVRPPKKEKKKVA